MIRTYGPRAALAVAFWALPTLHAMAAPTPTSAPILRIDTPMHTAMIRRLAVDPARERLITASDDKTVKIWQLPSGRLVSTLRVPLDAAHEGQLFALAVSPDGQRIAVAGWTCWDWERAACVYVFDSDSGEIIKRVAGLGDAVGAMAWSPDGRRLAIGLQGRSGVRVLRTDTFAEIGADREYADKVMELAYNEGGWLASVALDGRLRVYRPDFGLHGRIALSAGKRPATVRFAPRSRQLAVGFLDAPSVSVIDAMTFAPVVTRSLASDPLQRSLSNVAWSENGRILYAAGERSGDGTNLLMRFEDGKTPESIPMPALRVSELQALAGGRIAYAAEDPRIGVIDATGRLLLDRRSELFELAADPGQLRVSGDGASIELGARDGRSLRFHALDETGRTDPVRTTFLAPVRRSSEWRIDVSADGLALRVNDKVPVLDDYEIVRDFAFTPGTDAVAIGTEWALRLLNRDATERWSTRLSAIVRAVNVSGDGRFVIAALSDGTIRWFRVRDGRELLAYFPHADRQEWVAWTPAGYYMSSAHGDNLIGWHLNRDIGEAPDFYRAIQFERVLFKPEVVTNALRGTARTMAAENDFDIARLRDIAPPRLVIQKLDVRIGVDGQPIAKIRIAGQRRALPLNELTVFVDEIPVTPYRERAMAGNERDRFSRELEVALAGSGSEIRVESLTGPAMGFAETYLALPAGTPPAPSNTIRGDLYVLAIGNNAFPNLPDKDLGFAAQDAETIASALAASGRGVYKSVFTHVLSDRRESKPDRTTVLDALAFTRHAGADDTLVVFLASHGVSDRAGNYWFVPRDASADDLAAFSAGTTKPFPSFISWTRFFDALRDAAGRRILIVDTCAARGMQGKFKPHSLVKRSAASHFALMVASQEDEDSEEFEPAGHGLFTYALLQGLTPEADRDQDGRISIGEMFSAARPIVAKHGTQKPSLIGPEILHRTTLAGVLRTTAGQR